MSDHTYVVSTARRLRRCAALLLCTVTAVRAGAQVPLAATDSVLADRITSLAATGTMPGLRWAQVPDVSGDLQLAYASGNASLLWSRGGAPTAAARSLLDALQRVDERGLNRQDYDVERLDMLAGSGLASATARVEFDLTLSVAGLRVLRALRVGRISAGEAHAHLQLPVDAVDFTSELQKLATTRDAAAVLDATEPPYLHYRLLKHALARYRADTGATAAARAEQIALTLERWRWLPHQFSTTPIIVNIPAFKLHALSANSDREADMLTMDVVVGDATFHRTPVFSELMEYIVFSPYWDVPSSIANAELVPIGLRDPHLLTINHYQILDNRGRVLPATVASVRAVRAGAARIRQLPGGANALGGVKFVFPNEFNVYMHDTPNQAAFQRERRDLSHGCIRLSQPRALAQRLLRDQAGWDSTAIETAMRQRRPRQVALTRPVPVHVLYATAVAREDGAIQFYDDIYGHDATLARQLRRGYPYQRPVQDAIQLADAGSACSARVLAPTGGP